MSDDVIYRVPEEQDRAGWLALREALWPEVDPVQHGEEMDLLVENVERALVLVAVAEGRPVGFVEASLREWAEGAEGSPVGYVEGWYVTPEARRRGVGRELLREAETWAFTRGAREMGSDAALGNETGIAAHRAVGYHEVVRQVHLLRRLTAHGDEE